MNQNCFEQSGNQEEWKETYQTKHAVLTLSHIETVSSDKHLKMV